MNTINFFNIRKEQVSFLLENSLIAIPFNMLLASILSIDLFYNGASAKWVCIWAFCIYSTSYIRWIFSKNSMSMQLSEHAMQSILTWYFFLTLLMGMAWGSCYLIFLSSSTLLQEFIIILVLGGMSAGSIASLSVYFPIYLAYILPIFLPVIIYNYYLFTFDRNILATTFLLFIILLAVLAKQNGKLVIKIIDLLDQKELLINKLEVFSITDPLTALYNRRYFNKILQKECDRARRNKYPLGLVSIDIDNFKAINDFFGHPNGDKFLIYSADLLKTTFQRAGDTVFRLGGDEFAIIIANMPLKEIVSVCNVLKKKFRKNHLPFKKINASQQDIFHKVTLSIGIAYIPFTVASNIDIEEIILAADKALYQAKTQGKNKIILTEIL